VNPSVNSSFINPSANLHVEVESVSEAGKGNQEQVKLSKIAALRFSQPEPGLRSVSCEGKHLSTILHTHTSFCSSVIELNAWCVQQVRVSFYCIICNWLAMAFQLISSMNLLNDCLQNLAFGVRTEYCDRYRRVSGEK
jgi:hypothetical protein